MQSMRICVASEDRQLAEAVSESEVSVEEMGSTEVQVAEGCAACGAPVEDKFCGQECEVRFWSDLK